MDAHPIEAHSSRAVMICGESSSAPRGRHWARCSWVTGQGSPARYSRHDWGLPQTRCHPFVQQSLEGVGEAGGFYAQSRRMPSCETSPQCVRRWPRSLSTPVGTSVFARVSGDDVDDHDRDVGDRVELRVATQESRQLGRELDPHPIAELG